MVRDVLTAIGRGVGQVMFQENALSGLLMLAGLACGSWQAAVLALSGNAVGTLTAYLADFDREDIRRGLYGFNGTLVGIAVGVFMKIGMWTILLLILGAALSSLLYRRWPMRGVIPPFTAPFIIVTWCLLGLVHWQSPELLLPAPVAVPEVVPDVHGAFCRNLGQVMFQGATSWSGALFLLGIMVGSARSTIAAVVGAAVPLMFFFLGMGDYAEYNAGLLGYNAVLCAMALGVDRRPDAMWATLSVVLSVFMQVLGMRCGLVTLTAPFVLSVWLTMMLRNVTGRWGRSV